MIFEQIKQALTINQVVENYQGKIVKSRCVCPFHNDKKPSMYIYTKTQTYQCFVCGVGGDLINFVSRLHKCSNLDAAKIINQEFNLNFSLDNSRVNKREIENRKRKLQKEREKEQEKKDYYYQTLKEYEFYSNCVEVLKPKLGEPPMLGYAIALNKLQLVEFRINIL